MKNIFIHFEGQSPVNLTACFTFWKCKNKYNKALYDIVFEYGAEFGDRWSFNTEEERDRCYDKIIKLYSTEL
jgi:hypothetical protein